MHALGQWGRARSLTNQRFDYRQNAGERVERNLGLFSENSEGHYKKLWFLDSGIFHICCYNHSKSCYPSLLSSGRKMRKFEKGILLSTRDGLVFFVVVVCTSLWYFLICLFGFISQNINQLVIFKPQQPWPGSYKGWLNRCCKCIMHTMVFVWPASFISDDCLFSPHGCSFDVLSQCTLPSFNQMPCKLSLWAY